MQERFKQLLEDKNLTATRFAALIKVNASAMSHILNGRSKPGFDVLDKIAQAFPDVNLNWLISGKGSLYNNPSRTETPSRPKQADLFEEKKEPTMVPSPPHTDTVKAEPVQPSGLPSGLIPEKQKKIKRIILFFEDGSFEDYEK